MEASIILARICELKAGAVTNNYLMSLKKTDTVALEESEAWGSLVPLVNSQPLPTYSLSQD